MDANPAFSEIAPYYDRLMSSVNYEEWGRYVRELFGQARRGVRDVMDLACGTGNLTAVLRGMGYRVAGLDASGSMLRVAKAKLPDVRFFRGDFLDWGLEEDFDAVVCIYDSLNNLRSDEDMERAFVQVREHLRPGGIFVFDLNTVYGLKHYWGDNVKVTEEDGLVAVWRTMFLRPDTSQLHISLFAREKPGAWRRVDELHTERGYTKSQTLTLLKRAGFRTRRAYGHLSLLPPSRRAGRITYIAVK